MKKKLYLFLSLLSFTAYLAPAFAQPVASPDVKCLSVNQLNGNVTITWITPAGPAGFLDYKIYSAPAATGPYTLAGSVATFSQTSFVHAGAGANAARVYYKVLTNYNPGPVLSAPKDTFSTIFLIVTNPGNGLAQLAWNKISILPISTSTGWYRIYREYPTGIWSLRDSTQLLTYTDEIDICSATLNYRIEIADNTGCTSVSNEAGSASGTFTDQTPPTISPIDTVSVDAAGFATISWFPSPSPDADSIVIYKGASGSGPWIALVTVPVPLTSYTNIASVANTISEFYRIAFKDSCNNISAQGIVHRTIYLESTFDICAATASLKWNKYINMIPAVTQYKVYKSVLPGPFTLLTVNAASDTDYVDTGLALGSSYCYFILASNGSKTSSSNKTCFSANVSQPPTYHYNRYATVVSNSRIDIKAYVDPAATSVKYYNILRAVNGSGIFSTIATLPPTVGTVLSHSDLSVNAGTNSYLYIINAMDSCGHVITSSNADTTILLKGNIAPNLDINLSWNDYGSWLGNVDHYDIYCAVDGIWISTPIGASTTNSFTVDVAPYTNSKGAFSFKVIAYEGAGDTLGFTDSSASNVANVYEYPKILIPNAFTPNDDGLNDIFKPLLGFIDFSSYSFRIFDRTGTPIIITTNPAEGWDGKKKGHECPEGVYMYLINCKASNGDDSQLTGTVSLIR